jgi:hypothetical protein
MSYLIIEPKKMSNGQVMCVPTSMFDDVELAKKSARASRNSFAKRGWDRWAAKVAIKRPTTAQGFTEMADLIAEYWQELDWVSGGNSFAVEPLQAIEKRLREDAAQQLAIANVNPETVFQPCCGQCRHFDSSGDLDGNNGLCRAKSYREFHDNGSFTLCPKREATDEICDLYDEVCPF